MNGENQGTATGLTVEVDGGVATVTLNRPEAKNAITFEMWRTLATILSGFVHDDSVRVIVMRGANGDFSAGTDINDLATGSTDGPADRAAAFRGRMRIVSDVIELMETVPQPVVCAVTGCAIGGAMGIALSADLIVGGEDAWFRVGTVALGSMPDAGVPLHLYRSMGLRKAREICMLDERVPMAVAERYGLVNWVVPNTDVDDVARSVAERLAKQPAGQQMRIKRAMNAVPDRSLLEHLASEVRDVADCVQQAEYLDAVDGFVRS